MIRHMRDVYGSDHSLQGWECSNCGWRDDFPLIILPQRQKDIRKFRKDAEKVFELHDCLKFPKQSKK